MAALPCRPPRSARPSDHSPAIARAGRVLAGALLLLLLLPSAVLGACGHSTDARPGTATVVRVVDGDTIEVRSGRRTETVRLLGIDTPETVKPNAPVECFGPQASARTKALLHPGTEVVLTRDEELRDRYERLLAHVARVDDGLFVNRAMVADGFARTLSIAPNDAHEAELSRAQAEARAAGRGLWSACPPGG